MDLLEYFTKMQLVAMGIAAVVIVFLFKRCKEEEELEKSKVWKYLPFIAFCIGLTALCFQITVLYPWHNDLSVKLDELAKMVRK
jgi:formate-dependent nitrite reductase membrane component NrfD